MTKTSQFINTTCQVSPQQNGWRAGQFLPKGQA